ncbi:MAG: tetratricopeptide repeat protein [Planctomycetaceae bacterium]
MRRLDGNRYALQSPHCALERAEDLDEVRQMIAGGEPEIARDELLYLVADCRAFLEAHNLLGELALENEDVSLARGHYGFGYEIGMLCLGKDFRGTLPARRDYNPEFFLAGRGLARCLIARGQRQEGREVLEQLARLDPREELVRGLLDELDEQDRTGQIPPVINLSDENDDDEPDEE